MHALLHPLLLFPLLDFCVVACEQYPWDPMPLPFPDKDLRSRVDFRAGYAARFKRFSLAEDSRYKARDSVYQCRRGQFPARENERSHRHLLRLQYLLHAGVHAFVVAGDEEDVLFLGKFLGYCLVEQFPVGRKKNLLCRFPLSLSKGFLRRAQYPIWLKYHSRPTAIWAPVSPAVFIASKFFWIVKRYFYLLVFLRTTQYRAFQIWLPGVGEK